MRMWGLAAVALLAAGTAEATPRPTVDGVWVGKYICNQGVTQLTLSVKEARDGKLTATFRFGPPKENPSVPRGSFQMTGKFNPNSRKMELRGQEWIERPLGYEMVDLIGGVTRDGRTLAGHVPFTGCTVFELVRQEPLIS